MKRSNRLVLLVGIFLAIIAFVGILLLSSSTQQQPANLPPTELPTVIAAKDIPLGSRVTADQLKIENKAITARDADAFGDVSQVVGKIVRQNVVAGAAVTGTTLSGGAQGQILDIDCPATFRCMSVQVDQVTGVGTVIKSGDYVDMVMGITGANFPVITTNPVDKSFTVVAGLNGTSVKLLLQGMQVLGTLLPPPTAVQGDAAASPAPESGTALNGQQEIVILAVTAQQAEVIKFAQMDTSVSLLLRSPNDFIDPATGKPLTPVSDETTGIILKSLVDTYGVLPPQVIEAVLPTQPSAP